MNKRLAVIFLAAALTMGCASTRPQAEVNPSDANTKNLVPPENYQWPAEEGSPEHRNRKHEIRRRYFGGNPWFNPYALASGQEPDSSETAVPPDSLSLAPGK